MKEQELDEITALIRRAGSVIKVAIDDLVEIAEASLRIAVHSKASKTQIITVEPEKGYISTKELAKRLGISPITVHRLRKEGLPELRIGYRVLFDYERVAQWVEERNQMRK